MSKTESVTFFADVFTSDKSVWGMHCVILTTPYVTILILCSQWLDVPKDSYLIKYMQCDVIITRSIFSKVLTRETPYHVRDGQVWDVLSAFKSRLVFSCCDYSILCNILIYYAAL